MLLVHARIKQDRERVGIKSELKKGREGKKEAAAGGGDIEKETDTYQLALKWRLTKSFGKWAFCSPAACANLPFHSKSNKFHLLSDGTDQLILTGWEFEVGEWRTENF